MRSIVCGSFLACVVLGAAARADDEASARAIIDKALKATGGEEKLGKNKALTWKAKGTFYGLGQPIEISGEWFAQPPGQMKYQIEADFNGQKFPVVQVVNGDKGWASVMGGVEEMTADQLAAAKEELYARTVASLFPLKDKAYKLAPLGPAKVGDRPAVGVKVSRAGHEDVRLYFDKERGLLLKSQSRVKDPMTGQEMDQETLYSGYKDFDGIQRATKFTIKRDGKDYVEVQVRDYKAEPKLDDKVFAKPSG